MTTNPLLSPQRTESTRRALLALAAIAGLTAAIIVLSSQVVTDFLREGPIRVTSIEGDALRVLLGVGALAATAIAVAALWPRPHVLRLALAALALAGGIFLIHALLIPAASLVVAAVAVELSGGIPRERLRQFGPRRYPILWGMGGILSAGAVAGIVVLSVWLLQPLFDEGETLNESLAFSVEGLEQPTVAAAAPAPTARPEPVAGRADAVPTIPEMLEAEGTVEAEATVEPAAPERLEPEGTVEPSVRPEPVAGQPAAEPSLRPVPVEGGTDTTPEATGTLISRGELMGVDAFHTGSGDVLLVQGPEGNLILRFQDYSVQNGPDLHVYLTPDPDGDVHADGALDLGKVKATNGFVNYDVPAGVDPTIFRVAVIYCQPFSVTFATATLQ